MAKQTRAEIIAENRNLAALATMVSGKNPDGTDWTMAGGGAIGGVSAISSVTAAAVGVSATSQTMIAANLNRVYASFVNNGATNVTLFLGTPAVAGAGVVLNANGGAYEITAANLFKGIVTAITASGVSSLAIQEGI